MELRNAGGLEGAVFTPETYDDVRIWVQNRSTNTEIVASSTRLYLPVGVANMVAADADDTIWFDPEGGANAFSLERG